MKSLFNIICSIPSRIRLWLLKRAIRYIRNYFITKIDNTNGFNLYFELEDVKITISSKNLSSVTDTQSIKIPNSDLRVNKDISANKDIRAKK